MKQKMVLVISILVGLAALWLTNQYLQAKRRDIDAIKAQLYAGARRVWVVCAVRDLPADTVLQMTDLNQKESFERDVGKNTVLPDDADQVIGKKLKYSIEKAETLTWSSVDVPFAPTYGLATTVKPGMRAISISVGGAAAVSGLVMPNDRVDVLGSFYFPSETKPGEMEAVTLTVLQDVTILATGQLLAKQMADAYDRRKPPASYSMLTVEVTPREAELLVFAESMKGHLSLSLRNPSDVSYESTLPDINFARIQKELPELNAFRQHTIRHKKD
jgi:pilus assembly protein CpaB